MAGLIKDLKQRGLLDDTMIVWGLELGHTPGGQGAKGAAITGHDHQPHGFSVVMAGSGLKKKLCGRGDR